ncbi:MAG: DUF1800 domain-containing protein [Halopseudomonas aestusnigri]
MSLSSTKEISAFVAVQRYGMGPARSLGNNGSMKPIMSDPRGWLESQIKTPPAFTSGLSKQTRLESSTNIIKQVAGKRGDSEAAKKAVRSLAKKHYLNESVARFHQAVTSEQPLYERLVLFWSNHFTVSANKKNVIRPIVGAYEREAIRPHVLGTFPEMLRAAIQHPAMLLYLDNASSIGPNSQAGKRRGKGLNENLAREIMELHTLGVNGGYTQDDVIALAKIITGWTLTPRRQGGGGYSFIERLHEPGSHKLLGKNYSQLGESQGLAALDDLALHPSTAKFIATKLARHFIADEPAKEDIRTLSKTYLASNGDLKAMYRTLIRMEAPWRSPLSKVKSPYELLISSARLMAAQSNDITSSKFPFDDRAYRRLIKTLSTFEQLPFSAPSPAGWPDRAVDWISPKATLNRIEWCHAFAQALRPQVNPLELAREAIGAVSGPETLIWIERAPSPVEGLALLLASPEWQRR